MRSLFFQRAVLLLCAAITLAGQTVPLDYRPVAAEFSASLDRIILISGNPNRLRIYDPATGSERAVTLLQPPLSLSVSPDGRFAAVGHDASIAYVNLVTAAVEKVYPVPVVARGVVLAENWVYNAPSSSGNAVSVNLATGTVTPGSGVSYGSGGRLNVQRNAIYGTRDGTSPNDIHRYDIAGGPFRAQTDSPYHGDYCIYGPLWISPEGTRLYTGCGTIFRSSDDPKEDMYYLSSFAGLRSGIGAFDESLATRRIAVVPRAGDNFGGSTPSTADSSVLLYESTYFKSLGEFPLPRFAVGGNTVRSRGRWVFFNADSSLLYVVMQADQGSGLLNDFAIHRLSLADPGPCGATFAEASRSVGGLGAAGKVAITARADCSYRATSDVPWIELLGGAYGLGAGTLDYYVKPNPGPGARVGRVTMADQTFTISQAAPTVRQELSLLGYNVIDAAYSKRTDKLITISSNPNELHIYDPVARSEKAVALPTAPLSLSVHPSGQHAAVGHDGWLSYVNLEAGTVEKTFQVVTDVKGVVLAPNGFAYLFPSRDWSDIYSLEISTGKVTATSAIYNGRVPRLHSNGKTLYVGGNWFSKWDISQGTAKLASSSFGSNTCGNLWVTEDGRRLFTACGRALTTSDITTEDLQYNGAFSAASGVVWADHSMQRQVTAIIPTRGTSFGGSSGARQPEDTEVQFYGDAFLGYSGAVALPQYDVAGTMFPSRGRFVFWNRSTTAAYVVVQADARAGLLNSSAVVEISPAAAREVGVTTVVNGASLLPGRLAPGQIITITGSGLGPTQGASFRLDPITNRVPTILAGTQVLFNGVAAPILYTSQNQVNTIVPFEVGFQSEVTIQVLFEGLLSSGTKLPIGEAAPAIFTLNGNGSGQAVAINQDGTLCDARNPAPRGSFVTIYFTGGGVTNSSGTTGGVTGSVIRPLRQTALVTVADQPAQVTFAGAAPGFVEGVNQLNIRLADNTPVGLTQTVIVTVGTISSPATVTIAVR